MKNTKIALVLAILILTATTVTWGQATLGTGTPLAIGNQSADAVGNPSGGGGHMTRGCVLCHTPHNGGGVTVQGSSAGIKASSFNGSCVAAGGCAGAQGAAVGQETAGNIYLWGQALGQLTYTSWDSTGPTTFNQSAVTGGVGVLSHPEVHSLMCLSCHDGSTTGSSYDMGVSTAGINGGFGGSTGSGGQAGFGPPKLNGVSWSPYNAGWSTGSLMNSHPIHAHYTVGGATVPGLWNVAINATAFTVYFTDTTFNYWTPFAATGHPARLWTDGSNAFVECTSCHEPHRFSQYAYPVQGSWNPSDPGGTTWEIGPKNSTVYYLRGPYSDAAATTDGATTAGTGNTTANGELNAQFCRSCHYEKSIEYFNYGGTAR